MQQLLTKQTGILVCLLFCIPAHAQSPATSDVCQSDAKCMELYQTAANLTKTEQHVAALGLLQTAYAKYPAAWLLVHIGRAQQKLGRLPAAINSYRQYLASIETTTDPALTQKVQDYLRQAQSQVVDSCLVNPKCNELIELARSLSKTGQYEAALTLYQNAFTQFPASWLLVNIGRAQQKLGQLPQAIATYRQYLSSPEAQDDPELTRKAQEYLLQAENDYEPPPIMIETPPPPPPPPAPPPRPRCPDELEDSDEKRCERQKRSGLAITLALSGRRIVTRPSELSGSAAPESVGNLGGSLLFGYKIRRVLIGLGVEVDYATGSTQLVSQAGMATVSTSTTSYLIAPTLQLALVRALAGQLELFASAQLGLGQSLTRRTWSPAVPVMMAEGDSAVDSFRLGFQLAPGVRHFLSRQLALTLLCGLAVDSLFTTQDRARGLSTEQVRSLSLFGTLGALAVF